MNNSMISAMVSMNSMQQRLDMIADNMANLDTTGYKRKESNFDEVLTNVQNQPEGFKQKGRATGLGFTTGFGMQMASITSNMEQGSLKQTGNPTDLAMQGNGLFAVRANGTTAYTREGAFTFVPDKANPGNMILTNNQGYPVLDSNDQTISVSNKAKVAIDNKGRVHVESGGDTGIVATLQVVEPVRPEGLQQIDGNLFVVGDNAQGVLQGKSIDRMDTDRGIQSGYLEQSNVDYATEITDMMQVQRAYQLASRALTSSDTMMNLANNIRG
ncbi:flagellar hook-basal body protein [Paenibacillus pini]|uniref:Flagellar basal-body rod protein FlgG n=1 Tax=Paenibacillus pini JCM 16418 TaxID=1236976 RepID=W7YHZ5_9BACL|nr:flagellar hook-basal body protein [Paenibacillus pini]GAF10520.1 flagellar basal-body rod protein FlgG [Paenibacillus pini JCM 16418]